MFSQLLRNVHELCAIAFFVASHVRTIGIYTSTALGAEGVFIVAGAFFGARIFFAFRIEATAALLAKVLTFVRWDMSFAFFSASGILALSVKATATFGAKALTFVRLLRLKPLTRGESRSHNQG